MDLNKKERSVLKYLLKNVDNQGIVVFDDNYNGFQKHEIEDVISLLKDKDLVNPFWADSRIQEVSINNILQVKDILKQYNLKVILKKWITPIVIAILSGLILAILVHIFKLS